MAKNKNALSNAKVNDDILSSLMTPEVLEKLPEKTQKVAIDTVREVYRKERDGGVLGKIVGTNKVNASMNSAIILCIILIVAGFVVQEKEIWDKILTIIAAAIGYIFGVAQKDSPE